MYYLFQSGEGKTGVNLFLCSLSALSASCFAVLGCKSGRSSELQIFEKVFAFSLGLFFFFQNFEAKFCVYLLRFLEGKLNSKQHPRCPYAVITRYVVK